MTGVFVVGSLLLHAAKTKRPHTSTCKRKFLAQRRFGATADVNSETVFLFSIAPLRRCASNFFLIIVNRRSLIFSLRHWLARHTILTLNPTAKINKLTAFRTEGTERIVVPLDWLTAGWTLHES